MKIRIEESNSAGSKTFESAPEAKVYILSKGITILEHCKIIFYDGAGGAITFHKAPNNRLSLSTGSYFLPEEHKAVTEFYILFQYLFSKYYP